MLINEFIFQEMSDRQLKEIVRLAWGISPILAVFLPERLRNAEVIVREVTRLLRNSPEVLVVHALTRCTITGCYIFISNFRCSFC